MSRIRNQVAIVGVGYSDLAPHADKSLGALAIDACRTAISDAGLSVDDIDGISNYPNASRIGGGEQDGIDIVSVKYIAQALALKQLSWSCSITTGTIVASLVHAVNAVASGACDTVLVWRGMFSPPGKFGSFRSTHVSGDAQFSAPYGFASNVMIFAFAYARYMAVYGATREHMATYVVNARINASINPQAVFHGKPITRQDYLNARMIADPLSLLDCDRPVDGCGALVVTTAERARHLPHRPAYVVGGTAGGFKFSHSPVLDLESCMESAQVVARALWKNVPGLAASDMDFANIYDGFSFFIYPWLEAFGFCNEGEAFEYIQDGRIARDGAMPLNPSGGAIGMGRLHGSPQFIEAVLQLQGRAGARQLKKADVTLANSGSPLGTGAVVLSNEAI